MKVSPSKHPNYPWRVIWKEGTKWKNRFFKSERQAIAFSKRKAPQLRDVAPSDEPPTREERAALDAAKKHGVPLMEAIRCTERRDCQMTVKWPENSYGSAIFLIFGLFRRGILTDEAAT